MDARRFDSFLRGQALLVALLGAALALFLRTPALQTVWRLPELRLVLGTVFAATTEGPTGGLAIPNKVLARISAKADGQEVDTGHCA